MKYEKEKIKSSINKRLSFARQIRFSNFLEARLASCRKVIWVNLKYSKLYTVNMLYSDTPTNFSYTFQDPASQWMLGIIDLHDNILFFLIILLVVVLWFLVSAF